MISVNPKPVIFKVLQYFISVLGYLSVYLLQAVCRLYSAVNCLQSVLFLVKTQSADCMYNKGIGTFVVFHSEEQSLTVLPFSCWFCL